MTKLNSQTKMNQIGQKMTISNLKGSQSKVSRPQESSMRLRDGIFSYFMCPVFHFILRRKYERKR